MASLWLPAPSRSGPSRGISHVNETNQIIAIASENSAAVAPQQAVAPSYEERCRVAAEVSKLSVDERKGHKALFVPRSVKDFDDGGAFPEIHVAQFPRHMGNPHLTKSGAGAAGTVARSRALLNVEVDSSGSVSYDSIVTGGTNANKKVYSRHSDLAATKADPVDLALPTPEEEAAATAKTAAALNTLIASKTALDKPKGSAFMQAATSANQDSKTQFISYTPREDAPGYNAASAKQRVIQMVPLQLDPMMPPKHMHRKAPRGPAEDPVPILHAPPKKLSKEEQEAWNVPACISNWKNSRGYTIPLDKRLAADGRGLREHTINSNFATLSESLYVAERQAREEVRMRAQVQKRLVLSEKERREKELRDLAMRARLERSGVSTGVKEDDKTPDADSIVNDNDHDSDVILRHRDDNKRQSSSPSQQQAIPIPDDDDEAAVAAQQRERLRQERKRERERELRMEKRRLPVDDGVEIKRQRLEQDRDVSEKIALGVHTGSGGGGGVDSRLYNQSAGLDSGFGPEDEYNTYSKPLFDRDGVSSASIYRPSRGEGAAGMDADEQYEKLFKSGTSKFQPDQGFTGAEGSVGAVGSRNAPVQFEKGVQK